MTDLHIEDDKVNGVDILSPVQRLIKRPHDGRTVEQVYLKVLEVLDEVNHVIKEQSEKTLILRARVNREVLREMNNQGIIDESGGGGTRDPEWEKRWYDMSDLCEKLLVGLRQGKKLVDFQLKRGHITQLARTPIIWKKNDKVSMVIYDAWKGDNIGGPDSITLLGKCIEKLDREIEG